VKASPVLGLDRPLMKATTAIILIVISLAAVGAIAYGSYHERERSNDLEGRIVVLEHTSDETASEITRLTADKVKLCKSVDIVRQKITGVVLGPGSPRPNFDVQADPLSAPERTILMFYNWCHASE
jgi:hypothetical protein